MQDTQIVAHDLQDDKLKFIASILNSSNSGNGLDNLSMFNEFIQKDYESFANSVSLKEEVLAVKKLQSLQEELARLYSLKDIANKSVVAIGGGFSAGKSQFVSSFFADNTIELPIGINPVTAISTYIVNGSKHLIKGYTYQGGIIDIPLDLYRQLSHDFIKELGFNLKTILPMVAMETSIPEYTHICFVDTPGYNPSNSGFTGNDSNTATEALSNANALIWLIGLDTNGTIPQSDLEFLETLELDNKSLYVVANKADLKPKSEIEDILDHFEEILQDYDIDYKGISAYSSIKKQEITYRDTSLQDFINSVDRDIVSKDKLASELHEVILMYRNELNEQKNQKEHIKKTLKSLELDILEETNIESKVSDRIDTLMKLANANDINNALKDLESLEHKLLNKLNDIFKDIFGSGVNINQPRINELIRLGNDSYSSGKYNETKDYYKEALKLGADGAVFHHRLGYIYHAITKEYDKAVIHYKRASELGSAASFNNLGDMYKNGKGVEKDFHSAIECFTKASELKNSYAFNNLGNMYRKGDGVAQDYNKAIEYYKKGCELGCKAACENLKKLQLDSKV